MSETEGTEERTSNPMQAPRIGKVVINMSVGQSGEQLQKAMTVLEQLTGQKPCQRLAKKTIKEWNIRKGEPIACIVTLRKQTAEDFLKRAFEAIGNKLSSSSFDRLGNFAFGIDKHIDIAGTRYDPKLGIFGMDVCVSMRKAGYRVRRNSEMRTVGIKQRVTQEEATAYLREQFGINV